MTVAGYSWDLPQGVEQEGVAYVWVGSSDSILLQALQLSLNAARWVCVTPPQVALPGAESADGGAGAGAGAAPQSEAQGQGEQARQRALEEPCEACVVEQGLVRDTQLLLRRR